MANTTVAMQGADGRVVPIRATGNTDGTYLLAVNAAAVSVGAITVTTVPIVDAATAASAEVAAPGTLVPTSISLAAHDPAPLPQVSYAGRKDSAFLPSFGVAGAAFISADASAAAVAVTDAPTAGQKLVITDLVISSAAALTVTITEQTSATVKYKLYIPVAGTVSLMPSKFKLDTADKKLMVQTSGAGAVSVSASYYSEA